MKKYLFLMAVVVAVGLMNSCRQETEQPPLPEIELDMESLSFGYNVEQTQITVTTNREWEVETSADWLAFDPSSGGAVGESTSYKVTVTALRNPVGNSRTANVRFRTKAVYASLPVTQALNPDEAPTLIYKATFGEKLDGDNPALSNSTCWWGSAYESGYALAYRKYYTSSDKVTVRNSSSYNSTGYADVSGDNHLHFGSDMPSLVLGNLAIHAKIRTIGISFGLLRNLYQATDNVVKPEEFLLYVSKDAANWMQLTYTASPLQVDEWSLCSATISFEDAIDELYIRVVPTVASAYRFDDFTVTSSDAVDEDALIDWTAATQEFELGTEVTMQ